MAAVALRRKLGPFSTCNEADPASETKSSTTSFLTATTLIYALELELPRLLAPDLPPIVPR